MPVLDALFDHSQQVSSNVEITGSLVQCSPVSQAITAHQTSTIAWLLPVWPASDRYSVRSCNARRRRFLVSIPQDVFKILVANSDGVIFIPGVGFSVAFVNLQ